MNDTDNRGLWPPEEDVIFVPAEVYHGIHSAMNKTEQAADILRETSEELKRIDYST